MSGNSSGSLPVPAVNSARRQFLRNIGKVGVGSTAALLFGDLPILRGQSTSNNQDSPVEILTAAVIAEDLATVFYYQGLTQSSVIGDPALANGGTALAPGTNANIPNITYLRAAMAQEIAHANALRTNGNVSTGAMADPYQTFYFPASTFSNLTNFLATLNILESAFIAAYLNAIREFSTLAYRAGLKNTPTGPNGGPFSAAQLSYYTEIAASILGVECEHRVLGKVISNTTQPNNVYFEQTNVQLSSTSSFGMNSVYHGSYSAVAALTPFLSSSTGPGYSLATALSAETSLGVASSSTSAAPPPVANVPASSNT